MLSTPASGSPHPLVSYHITIYGLQDWRQERKRCYKGALQALRHGMRASEVSWGSLRPLLARLHEVSGERADEAVQFMSPAAPTSVGGAPHPSRSTCRSTGMGA